MTKEKGSDLTAIGRVAIYFTKEIKALRYNPCLASEREKE